MPDMYHAEILDIGILSDSYGLFFTAPDNCVEPDAAVSAYCDVVSDEPRPVSYVYTLIDIHYVPPYPVF
jgi:hypothetical protein